MGCLGVFAIVMGIIAFFVMELPLLFFLLILPLAIVLLIAFLAWLRK